MRQQGRRVVTAWAMTLVVLVAGLAMASSTATASGVPYRPGDVFAGIGAGKVGHYTSSGTHVDTLDSGTNSLQTTGMTFDKAGNLYGTDFHAGCANPLSCTSGGAVSKYDTLGNLVAQFTGGPMQLPESVVQDNAGNFYVGQAGPGVFVKPDHPLLKFDPTGKFLTEFFPSVESRGADWVDLAADQCTLLYTSEGKRVMRFDVCQNRQLPDLASLPILGPVADGGEVAFALRIRPNGEVLVAAWTRVFRLDANGTILQEYRIPGVGVPGTSELFALNLDPDGTSFWTAEQESGHVYKLDIATGRVLTDFIAQPANNYGTNGLAVFGELTAAKPRSIVLAPRSATRLVEDPMSMTATLVNFVAPSGTPVTFTVTGANPQVKTVAADGSGNAVLTYVGHRAGVDTVVATSNNVRSNASSITWKRRPTRLTYNGSTTSDYHDPAAVSATLVDLTTSAPLADKAVTLSLNGRTTCAATTDGGGFAACPLTPDEAAGTYPVTASYAGDDTYLASNASVDFVVTREETTLMYTGPRRIANGQPFEFTALLQEDGAAPIGGRPVVITLGSGSSTQTCSPPPVTDTSGIATCTIVPEQPLDASTAVPLDATFAGDAFYRPSSTSATVGLQFETGRAFAASAEASVLGLLTARVPATPDTGQVRTASATTTGTPCVVSVTSFIGPLSAHSLCANVTTGVNPGTSTVTASIADATIAVAGLPVIGLQAVKAVSTSSCGGTSGSTTIARLTIAGVPLDVSNLMPNTRISLGGVTLVVNEQQPVPGADDGLTVNGVHLHLSGLVSADVIVASATSDIHNCAFRLR